MAGIANYGDLKADLAAYGQRTDLTARIPGFLKIAQNQVNIDLRIPEMIKTATLTVTTVGDEFALPDDYLATRQLTGARGDGSIGPLESKGIDEIFGFGTSGTPMAYTVWNNEILIRPTPAENAVFTLIYWARPAEFILDADTSDILTRYSQVFLYAGLVELHTFVQSYEEATLAAQRYDGAIVAINEAGMDKRQRLSVAGAFNYSSVGDF